MKSLLKTRLKPTVILEFALFRFCLFVKYLPNALVFSKRYLTFVASTAMCEDLFSVLKERFHQPLTDNDALLQGSTFAVYF